MTWDECAVFRLWDSTAVFLAVFIGVLGFLCTTFFWWRMRKGDVGRVCRLPPLGQYCCLPCCLHRSLGFCVFIEDGDGKEDPKVGLGFNIFF